MNAPLPRLVIGYASALSERMAARRVRNAQTLQRLIADKEAGDLLCPPYVQLPAEVEERIKRPFVRNTVPKPHLEQSVITSLHRRYFNRVVFTKKRYRELKRESFERRNPFVVLEAE